MKTDYTENETWQEVLEVIKENAPKGLYEQWQDVTPLAMSPFIGGIYNECDKTENSYNWIDTDSNNIVYQACYINDEFVFIAFHKHGDVRGNYTDYFLFKIEDIEHLLYGFDNELWQEMKGCLE